MKFRREPRWILLAAAANILVGCAGSPGQGPNWPPASWGQEKCETADEDGEVSVRYDSIAALMDDDRHRAALAHIQLLENDYGQTQRSQLWRARALRHIGRLDEAQELYERLIEGCHAAAAYHGLGRVVGEKGDWPASRVALEHAGERNPVSPAIHNDLGYALLKVGEFRPAAEHFQTALELDSAHSRAANNLVLALLLLGEDGKAERLMDSLDMPASQRGKLESGADAWEVSG